MKTVFIYIIHELSPSVRDGLLAIFEHKKDRAGLNPPGP